MQRAEGRDGRGRRASVGDDASIRRPPPRVRVRVGVFVDVFRAPQYHGAAVWGGHGRGESQPRGRVRVVSRPVATRVGRIAAIVQSGEVESRLRRQRMVQELRLEHRVRLAGDDAWRRPGSVRVRVRGGGGGGGVIARGRARRERRDRNGGRSAGRGREAGRRAATSRGEFAAVRVGARRAEGIVGLRGGVHDDVVQE